MANTQELIAIIERDLKLAVQKVQAVRKMKGEQRLNQVESLKRNQIKRLTRYANSLQVTINDMEDDTDQALIHKHKEKLQQFNQRIQELRSNLEYSKHEGLSQKDVFNNRKVGQSQSDLKEKLLRECDTAQKASEEGVRRALRNMYEMKEISNTVNIELEKQMEQLDKVYSTLQDTQSNMKRAARLISYFARAVYTDKLLLGLIVLIVITIVVIVILSAMGKIPGAKTDILP